MSKHEDTFTVELPLPETLEVCKEASAILGWKILDETNNYISCKEVTSQITSFTWPAKVDVYLETNEKHTTIRFAGSIWGLGPIQSGHLHGQMGRFRNLIEVTVKKYIKETKPSDSNSSITAQLERLADLHSKGLLNSDEFKSAKEKLLKR